MLAIFIGDYKVISIDEEVLKRESFHNSSTFRLLWLG